VTKGETTKIFAETRAGYMMKIKAAEYFIDAIGVSGKGIPLVTSDGKFDTQSEMVTAEIVNNQFTAGEHVVYIHAMERNNKWGDFYPIQFTIKPDGTFVYSGRMGPEEGEISDEDQINIEFKEESTMNIFSGLLTSYVFRNEKNPIVYVNITCNIDAGEIKTIIEVLKNISSLATSQPPGEVYKNINIRVGPKGFAVPENITEGSIEFKVTSSWLKENNIKEVILYQYTDNEWAPLKTEKIAVKGENTYYSAKTRHFSPFAISGIKASEPGILYTNLVSILIILALILISVLLLIIKKRIR
jgi:PGF-pre-PGF domain-containing protein